MNPYVGITALGLVSFAAALGTRATVLNLPSITVRECSGPTTTITLDGRSYLTVGGDVQFQWQLAEGSVARIEDADTAQPRITFAMRDECEVSTSVTLVVQSGQRFARATTLVIVRDTVPPLIECPESLVITDDQPTDPASTGYAAAFDDRAGKVDVTYTDDTSAEGTIVRTWSASDGCQSTRSVQTLTVLSAATGPHFDILPGLCPNRIPVYGGGGSSAVAAGLPTALLANAFDVTQVDLNSVRLIRPAGANLAKGEVHVYPIDTSLTDTGTPFLGSPCDCHGLGGDGKRDLNLIFDLQEVVQKFGLDVEPNNTSVELQLRWSNIGGTTRFRASDCVRILNQ